MAKENIVLTAYCFLAALTETQNDLYQGVFIPIVKRTLSYYSLNGGEYGKDIDLQDKIKELYGIDVPLIVIRQLLRAVEAGMSNREKGGSGFKTLENGKCFQVKQYTFLELEDKYKEGRRNAQAIQNAFEIYLKDKQIDDPNIPSFADFLSKNRIKLTSFFKGQTLINGDAFDKSHIHHINFLETIEQNHHQLFNIAESLYLGSIVASLFECEFDYEARYSSDETYYLDTQIVLKALDLQGESDTRPIIELLSLIKESGAKVKILDITVNEISYHVEVAIKNYNNSSPTTTINEACVRQNKNRAWLIALNGDLENILRNKLEADIENISLPLKENFKKASDLQELQSRRRKQANAEHDVFAYLFVREKRKGFLKAHQKAKIWFLTANKNLLFFNISKSGFGNVPEVTLPDTLTTLLWLRNPKKFNVAIKSIGLNELISTTLNDEIATKELINEFDSNLKLNKEISQDDYQILISSIAYQSARYIEKLNHLAIDGNTEEFSIQAHKLVENEKMRRSSVQETIKRATVLTKEKTEENENLKERLKNLEEQIALSNTMSEQNKTELEKLSDLVNAQKKHIKQFIIGLIATAIICVLLYLNYNFNLFIETAKTVINIILGFGGLWSFGIFIINLLKVIAGGKKR
jgi:hypothetical protein